MTTTITQHETYFLQRLDPYRIRHYKGNEYRAKCPFCGGNNGSKLSIEMEEAKYYCFGCQYGNRGIVTFEQKLGEAEGSVHLPYEIAKGKVEEILGTPFQKRICPEPLENLKKGKGANRKWARDRYVYTDEIGNEIFSVWRFEDGKGGKTPLPDQPCVCSADAVCEVCGGDGRVWGLKGVERVPYRLPALVQALLVFVVEGEKNANDLDRALAVYLKKAKGLQFGALNLDHVAVTTNQGGSSGWKPELRYGRYFAGKTVIKLGDNDAPGRLHDEAVCKDVANYAREVYRLPLPVGEGEDISDFLAANPIEALWKIIHTRIPWQMPEQKKNVIELPDAPRQILVKPSQLVRGIQEGGEWLVDRLIPRHGRGLVIAPPKTGKSFFFLDLALALGTMSSVLGIKPFGRPVKVGIISREDGPQLVSERLHALASGRGIPWSLVDANIRINTTEQSQRFKIDNDDDLKEMAEWLRAEMIEFTVIDVLNKLHNGEENSANEMTKVMAKFDELARLSGSDICVIHHTNKVGGARGSSSIEGWADYIFRLEADVENESLKTLYVRTKASGQPTPKQMLYEQSPDMKQSRITLAVRR